MLILLLAVVLAGCGGSSSKTMNRRVTLWRNDKIPYGAWYAYTNVKDFFPHANVIINRRSPDRYRLFSGRSLKNTEEDALYEGKKSTYIIIGTQVYPDQNELQAMLQQVSQGETIFISSMSISERLLDTLHLRAGYFSGFLKTSDSLTISIQHPLSNEQLVYTYPGMALDNYFQDVDSTITTVLGRDEKGRANFVKFTYEGGGAIYIHLAPAAFTNFFLLHKNNKSYFDNVMSYLPNNTEVVRWDEYFRYSVDGEGNSDSANSGFSAMRWMGKQPSLASGLWLLAVLLLLIYLFESKRKQRYIPDASRLKNSSLDFVKTIGRLYFQRKDNKDLAQKMTAFFMDHVRTRYNIKGSLRDEDFEKRLVHKSGYDPAAIKNMLYYLKFTQEQPSISDDELLRLNQKLDNFYKHT